MSGPDKQKLYRREECFAKSKDESYTNAKKVDEYRTSCYEDEDDEKTLQEKMVEAIYARRPSNALRLLKEADVAERRSIARYSQMMAFIITKIDKPLIDGFLDLLYEHARFTDVVLACTHRRFGISVREKPDTAPAKLSETSEQKPLPWTLNGAKALYRALLKLPASQVQTIRSIVSVQADDKTASEMWAGVGAVRITYHGVSASKDETKRTDDGE